MTRNITHTCLTIASVVVLGMVVAVPPARSAGPCSLARAAGNYSFTDNGTVIGVGPRTAVGRFTLDAAGNLTDGTATSSLNGSVASETFSGTYTINSDCTGSIDVKIYSGSTELFEVKAFASYDDDMRQLRAIFTSVTTPDGIVLPTVISIEARKQ